MTRALTKMFLARRRLGLTQAQVAEAIGVTQPRISAWETRTVPIPDARLGPLSELLGVAANELALDA